MRRRPMVLAVRFQGVAFLVAGTAGVINSVWPFAGVLLAGGAAMVAWSILIDR